jgi:hypothetical protein
MSTEDRNKQKWIRDRFNTVYSEALSSFAEIREKEFKAWDIFNGNYRTERFKYLTEVENFVYPARFRNIGGEIVRSKLQLLFSKQARRNFHFKAVTIDERSLKEKVMNRIKAELEAVNSMYDDRSSQIDAQIQMVQDQFNQVRERLQVQPENEEMAMQLQELQANMPMIEYEFNRIIRLLSKEKLNVNELQAKINYFLLHTEQEVIQHVANAALKSAIQTEDLYEHWHNGFREKAVTGRPTYLVNYNKQTEDVSFKQVEAVFSYFSRGGNNRWSQNGEWCGYKEWMDLSQISTEFNLNDNEYKLLEAYRGSNLSAMANYSDNSAYFEHHSGNGARYFKNNQIEVVRLWFNEPRKQDYKLSPNKRRAGEYFVNLIDENARIKSNEERRTAYIYDQYYCVLIGGVIFINNGVQHNVFRPLDTPGLPMLPVVSRSFNTISDKPYSILQRVADLIDMYNIVHYKKELAIALAGVRGMIMDASQKPDSMTTQKWTYYRRLGTMWIETMKQGRKIPATFNQFQNYDDSLSESFRLYDECLYGIEMLINKTIGVTEASLGQFVEKDPVKNVQMSRETTDLITEMLFTDNDKTFSQALDLYLNLKIQFVWNKGKIINYVNDDLEEVLVQIPKSQLSGANFRIFTSNNMKEEELLENVRQAAVQSWSQGQLPLESISKIMRVDDIVELEKQLVTMANRAEQLKTEQAQAIDSNKAELDQQTMQLESELAMQLEQMKQEVAGAKIQLDQARLEFDTQKFQWETQFKEKELEIKSGLEGMKIQAQNSIESAYLEEEGRSNRVQEMLKMFEMKINSMLQEMGIRAGENDSVRKANVAKEKEKNMRNKVNLKS